MKHTKNLFILIAAAAVMTACSEWDDHYDGGNAGDGLSIMQLLDNDPQTTHFAQLVRSSGHSELIASTQSFTVFAPTNEALSGFDDSNATAVRQLVTNHIARYTHPSSTPATEGVRMIDGKIYFFDSAESFAGKRLDTSNERASNGLIHKLSAQIPYSYNLYEYIQSHDNLSKLHEFIKRFDETRMDMEHSIEIGIDDNGRPVYDTVTVSYNRLLEDKLYGIGSIGDEDSVYTMLLPDNAAWQQIYERIAPSFKLYDEDQAYADSVQDVRTCLAIVSDLIFREAPDSPSSADSLVTTTGSVIHSPASLFDGAQRDKMSNGTAFVVSELNYDNVETWNKAIGVESEKQNGRTYNNTQTSIYTRIVTSESNVGGVSGDSYIEVLPISTSFNPAVTFEIPDILAGKYNVYAVFLPASVEGHAEADSTRISFTLSYLNDKGRNTTKNNKAKTLLTNGNGITKMLAFEDMEIPVSNYTDRLWLSDEKNNPDSNETTTKLTITTNVTNSEFASKLFARSFRLDRIILEPIKQ